MFNFELTLDEANLILAALGKQQYDAVAGLIMKIKQQAEPQIPRVQKELEEAATQQKAAAEQPAEQAA